MYPLNHHHYIALNSPAERAEPSPLQYCISTLAFCLSGERHLCLAPSSQQDQGGGAGGSVEL
jgi:hypothetical protein